jgi:hypothetical protein
VAPGSHARQSAGAALRHRGRRPVRRPYNHTRLAVTEAAQQVGWNLATVYYTRKGDRDFDARVVAASAAARTRDPGVHAAELP